VSINRQKRPEPMKRTASVETEGAELVYDVQGTGEPLLMIPGAVAATRWRTARWRAS
jgi:hypothetical protein